MRRVGIAGKVESRRIAFGIPDSPAGRVVAELPLAWAWVNGEFQVIVCCQGVHYPNCELASSKEIASMI